MLNLKEIMDAVNMRWLQAANKVTGLTVYFVTWFYRHKRKSGWFSLCVWARAYMYTRSEKLC